jgi:hypothetical protein
VDANAGALLLSRRTCGSEAGGAGGAGGAGEGTATSEAADPSATSSAAGFALTVRFVGVRFTGSTLFSVSTGSFPDPASDSSGSTFARLTRLRTVAVLRAGSFGARLSAASGANNSDNSCSASPSFFPVVPAPFFAVAFEARFAVAFPAVLTARVDLLLAVFALGVDPASSASKTSTA